MLKSLIILIIGSFVFSTAAASEKFACSTSKHTVIVTLLPSGNYQYRAWNRPKSITGKPDVLIVGGEEITEGTGVCRYTRWEFTSNNVRYVVSTPVACTEDMPPPNATGRLSVFINGEHRKSWWCFR